MITDSSSQFAIEMVGLTKRFGDQTVVNDLTLGIMKGQIFGFIGPNGAGKTTTIKMLMGMLRLTSGEARILGIDIANMEAIKQRIGYVPELHFMYRCMRVRELIDFCRSLYDNWNDQRCADLLKLFELDIHKKVRHLSKGMAAKLALLVAIAHEPEVMILDEPTSGLDPIVREEFLDGLLRTICEREQTVLFSSHTLHDVQRLADTIGIICEGRLLVNCPTDDLVCNTKRIRVVLQDGCSPGEPPDGTIWQRFQHREWLLTVNEFSQSTLDYLHKNHPTNNVEVMDLGLEAVFKDYIRGWRASK